MAKIITYMPSGYHIGESGGITRDSQKIKMSKKDRKYFRLIQKLNKRYLDLPDEITIRFANSLKNKQWEERDSWLEAFDLINQKTIKLQNKCSPGPTVTPPPRDNGRKELI